MKYKNTPYLTYWGLKKVPQLDLGFGTTDISHYLKDFSDTSHERSPTNIGGKSLFSPSPSLSPSIVKLGSSR
jgi:hypothetical protein